MGDFSKKLLGIFLGISLSLGVGVSLSNSVHHEAVGVEAATSTLTIQTSDFNTTSYDANTGGTKTIGDVAYKWVSTSVMQSSKVMQWKKSKGVIYNETALGVGITSIKLTFSSGSFTYGVASTSTGLDKATYSSLTSGTAVSISTGNPYFKIKTGLSDTGKSSKLEVTFESVSDSISIAEDKTITLTEGESNSSLAYTSTGVGAESAVLQSGTNVATFALSNGNITINTTKGITGTGIYILQKGTTLSENTITVVVNESKEPSIDFDLSSINVDALLLDEIYEIPYTLKNVNNPNVIFKSSNENILVSDENSKLQIMTGSQTEITVDTSFTVTYSVKDGDTEVIGEKTLDFNVLAPTLTLSDDDLTIKLGKSEEISFAFANFGNDEDTTIASSIKTGFSEIVTTSIEENKLIITGDADGATIVDLTIKNGNRSLTKSIAITVEYEKYNADTYVKLESDAIVEEGTYLLAYESSSCTAYVFNGKDETSNYVSGTINSGTIAANGTVDAVKLLLSKNTDGTFYVQVSGGDNDGLYFNYSKNDNGLTFSETTKAKYTIVFDATYGLLIKNTNGAVLRFNNTSGQTRFRFYKTSTYTGDSYKAISLYKLTEANTALGYATEFKKTLTTPCADSSSNNQAKVEAVWSELSARFTRLRASVQTELKNGTSTEATVLEALELYDHIVRRYGNEIINDFMARGITHNASNITYKTSNSNTTILVVILVTFASVTAVGGYFFLRKRKTY